METVCQLSYPLNSENASPFGTRTVYLASPASCAEVGLLPKTARTERASDTTTTTTGGILLLHRRHSPRCSPWLPLGELDGAKRSACSKVSGALLHLRDFTSWANSPNAAAPH